MKSHIESTDYETAKILMGEMVAHSQHEGEGTEDFITHVGTMLEDLGLETSSVADPDYPNKSLLIVEIGDKSGEQLLTNISHADVVGVDGQNWNTDPFSLTEENDTWFGRGVCDTHGSGVSMILACLDPQVQQTLRETGKKINVVFTYDEEDPTEELSMRGAKLAAGLLGVEAVAKGPYFIAGEPTEYNNVMVPMRSNKGRWLAHFTVTVERPGHVSSNVQNALMLGADVVHRIGEYARTLGYGSSKDEEAQIFDPAFTSIQVSAADVKKGDFSTTPEKVRFSVDMRTIPDVHELRVREITDLLESYNIGQDASLTIEVSENAQGSLTRADSPIITLAEEVCGTQAKGFNGGDEGWVFRPYAGMDGITLGPGELLHAHQPNERIRIESIFRAAKIYKELYMRLGSVNET